MVRDRVRLATPESSESDSGSSQAGVGGGDGAGVARTLRDFRLVTTAQERWAVNEMQRRLGGPEALAARPADVAGEVRLLRFLRESVWERDRVEPHLAMKTTAEDVYQARISSHQDGRGLHCV